MKNNDPFYEKRLNRLFGSIYFLPMVGVVPTVWTQMRQGRGESQQQSNSRLALKVHMFWAVSYALLWLGSLQTTETIAFRLLYLNTVVTSGYIVTCLFLVLRAQREKK